jgi:hypothetical protein
MLGRVGLLWRMQYNTLCQLFSLAFYIGIPIQIVRKKKKNHDDFVDIFFNFLFLKIISKNLVLFRHKFKVFLKINIFKKYGKIQIKIFSAF